MSLTEMPAVVLRITDPSAQPVRCRSVILVGAAVDDLERIKREYEAQGMVAEVEADMQLGGAA